MKVVCFPTAVFIPNFSFLGRYDCQHPVWSCTWNATDKNYLYAGLQNGSVFVFDVRNLSEPVQQLNQDTTSRSPVVSLQYLPQNAGLAR
jgi:E3 ubiquitin-protein ligase RFWD3